jgi:hypothetical protein
VAGPPWRLEEFSEEFAIWRGSYDPSLVYRRLVISWAKDVEEAGPTDDAIYLDDPSDGYEILEPIRGTTVYNSCLVYPKEGRVIVVDIKG